MPSIEIITSITGGKDELLEVVEGGNAKFIAYVDDLTQPSKGWELRPAYDKFKDPRRNSRIHKIMIHKYSDADYTIWADGSVFLQTTPETIIEKYMKGYEMAIYRHQGRECLYKEALVCAQLKLDDPELIIEQAKYYEDHGFPKEKGLCEGAFIIRKNCQKTRDFNEAWWADYCRFSRRDQISLPVALDKVGVNVNMVDSKWNLYPTAAIREDNMVGMKPHLHTEGNFNQ